MTKKSELAAITDAEAIERGFESAAQYAKMGDQLIALITAMERPDGMVTVLSMYFVIEMLVRSLATIALSSVSAEDAKELREELVFTLVNICVESLGCEVGNLSMQAQEPTEAGEPTPVGEKKNETVH